QATGGALNWQVGGDAELVQGTVGGTTAIATGGNLALDTLQATGNVGTQSGADTTIAQLVVSQGKLASTAQGNLGVTGKVDVQNGSAMLKSGAAMQLAEVDSQGDLAATAGTTLAA
ncbi:hypothetical protein WHJ71_14630, partial [Staphylococcus aureus]|uniref:hypothetical protein n=1 Tax=Staphylococcus aureus TaxID=1280 RepID=UPI0039BDD784